MSMNYYNPATADLANSAAQQAYYDALARGSDQNTALAWAKFQWQQKLDEAGQTGMWNGQWNNPQEQWFTGQFGQWYGPGGAPNVGDLTQAAQQQQYSQQQGYGQMYGQYYAPGTGPVAGTQTQAALQQQQANAYQTAGLTGWYTPTQNANVSPSRFNYDASAGEKQAYLDAAQGDANLAASRWAADASNAVAQFNKEHPAQAQQTLAGQQQQFMQGLQTEQEARAAQAQQQSQAMGYLNLLSNLRGPADWAKYQQVLGSTPGGMRDLVAAAMGQYVPGGGATTGVPTQAVSLQSMMGDVSGNPYTGQGGGPLNMPSVYGSGNGQMAADVYNNYWNQTSPNNQQYSYGQVSGTPNYYGRPSEQQNLGTTGQAYNYLPGTYSGQQAGAPRASTDVMTAAQAGLQPAPQGQAQAQAPQWGGLNQRWTGGNAQAPTGNEQWAGATGQRLGGGYATQGAAGQVGGMQMQRWTGDGTQAPTGNEQWASGAARGGSGGLGMGQFGVAQPAQVWGSGVGVGSQGATPQQQQQGLGNGTNLPAPNQISSQSWKNMAPSQQQMLLGMYENQGWDKNDVQALYNQSLPKYGANQSTGGTWSLR